MDERIRAIWNTPARQIAAETWKRSKNERETIIREFKARLNHNDPDEVRGYLVELGDREATKAQVQKMVADGLHLDPGLGTSGSPIAIQYLAPYAFSQEPYSQSGTDVITVPLSFMVTHVIFEILSDSSAFTGEVTNWARRVKAPDPERRRAEFQRWWEENKIYFEQEDYKAVKPGRPIPSVFEVADENRRKVGLPPLEETRPKQPAPTPPPAMPQPVPAPVAQTPAPAVEHQAPVWTWVAGIAALFAIIVVALKRRAN